MKFTLDRASNCDDTNLLVSNDAFKTVLRQQGIQAGKKLVSTLFCCCCCVDNPSSSLLLLAANKAGVPPTELVSSESTGHYVISYVEKTADGLERKIPLLFTAEENIANGLLNELAQIYIKSSQMTVLSNTTSLEELDSQAKIWHKLFNLPDKSKGTQEIEFNGAWAKQGGSIVDFAKSYQRPVFEVRSLAETSTDVGLARTNRI